MRKRDVPRDLEDAVRDVLGTMFFTEVLGDSGGMIPEAGAVDVTIGFTGESEGQLQVRVPAATAGVLAANFLGTMPEDELRPEQVSEVLREMGNMLCGAFLSRHESEQLYELSSPELVKAGGSESRPGAERDERSLQLDNGSLDLTLHWRSVPGAKA